MFDTGEPDDLERCERPPSKADAAAVANNNVLGLSQQDEYILPSAIADLVPYEPPLDDILGQGSTSLIARIKPGIVVKYPRYSWWHCTTAETHPFVKDTKHNFEVEERLLDILGAHPRIIQYVTRKAGSSLR